MSEVLQEFLNQNFHRVYPLTDESGGEDVTGSFQLPTSLITDIFLCAPNIPQVDRSKFCIDRVIVRRQYIDIVLGYDDPAVTLPLGVFKDIDVSGPVNSVYQFIPSQTQSGDELAPLYFMTGQIIIGDATDIIKYLGAWTFNQSGPATSTKIVSSRVSAGLVNVQYLSIDDRLYTGNVRLREGNGIQLRVDTEGDETVITVSASLAAGSSLSLANDEDVLNALIDWFGVPVRTINGLLPDADRNFQLTGADCTSVEETGDHGVTISNPCAKPCCDEDTNIQNLMDSVANLNLRYAQLKGFYDAAARMLTNQQNKLLIMGSEM